MIELLILTLILGPKSFGDERAEPAASDSMYHVSVDYSAGFHQTILAC
jgi:hypothetical protein